MSSLVLWSSWQCAALSTAPPPAPLWREASGAVDNACAKPGEFRVRLVCGSMPTAQKRTFRSAFSDTHRSWQVAVSEGGTCTRGLRITFSKRPTFTGLPSSPRVCLRSTTNTQGSPSHRLTILPSQNAGVHVPDRQFITALAHYNVIFRVTAGV